MSDRKYGHIYTESDVAAIVQWLWEFDDDITPNRAMRMLTNGEADIRLKFDRDEPLFVLRGRDKKAEGAIKHYEDHQAPNAPHNHLDGIRASRLAFQQYRQEHPGKMKDPD